MTKVPFLDVGATYMSLQPEIDAAVKRVLSSGWYILGPEVAAFEAAFAQYCGVKHAVGLANGLDAMHLVLRAWDIGPGDEVIVPSNTYIATWLAVTMTGALPVPVEPVAGTFNLDPQRIEDALSARTRAILPVHLYGQTAEMSAIVEIADHHGLRVLEDAAQAHGARWQNQPAGSLGHAAAWSFYPGKNLGAFGDAGGITTNDDETADRVRVLRNYGSRKKYYNEVPGYNSRLDPLQAAVLGVKLAHLDGWNARRRVLAARYDTALAKCAGVQTPTAAIGADPAWHLYVVQSPERDALKAHLSALGVETLIHYPIPPHRSDAYRSSPWAQSSFPLAEQIADRALSLPIGPHLTDAQQEQVIDAIGSFASRG